MALTAELQSQYDFQVALLALQSEREAAVDSDRHAKQVELEEYRSEQNRLQQLRTAKLETIRLAKEVLLENARSRPVDSRDVSANDITAFAETLMSSIDN
jgi:predicted transcriptional regulator